MLILQYLFGAVGLAILAITLAIALVAGMITFCGWLMAVFSRFGPDKQSRLALKPVMAGAVGKTDPLKKAVESSDAAAAAPLKP